MYVPWRGACLLALLPLEAAAEGVCAVGPYRYLALEGGGVRGIAYAGAIQALDDAGVLAGVHGFAGTSAGSIGAALLAAGYSAADVAEELRVIDFNLFMDSTGSRLLDLSRLLATFGWHQGEVLERVVDGLLERKMGQANATFAQLHARTGRELRVAAVRANDGALVYFDRHSFGEMPVARAVRASSSIPFFFRPVEHLGGLYVDGGLLRSLPFDAFAGERRSGEAVLGLSLMRSGRLSGVERKERFESLPEFALQLLAIFGSAATNKIGDYDPDDEERDLVSFNLTELSPIAFDLCEAHKRFLVSVGYNAVADRLVRCNRTAEKGLKRPGRLEFGSCDSARPSSAPERDLEHVLQLAKDVLGLSEPGRDRQKWSGRRALVVVTLVCVLVSGIGWRKRRCLSCWWSRRRASGPPGLPDVGLLTDDACIELQRRLCDELCHRLGKRKSS